MRPSSLLAVIILAGAGCAQTPKDEAASTAAPTPAFTPAAPGETVEPAALVLAGGVDVFFRAMGERQGSLRVTRVEEPASGAGAREWKVTHLVEMAEPAGQPAAEPGSAGAGGSSGGRRSERVITLVQTEDGSLAMSREENRAERVIVEFIPPLIVYPARLVAGTPMEQTLRMVVHPISNPSRVQNQGDAKQTLRFEGRERIETPLGMLETIKIAGALEADLGGPQVRNESQDWLAPRVGVAALKQMERTMMLGLRVRANTDWWVVERVGP